MTVIPLNRARVKRLMKEFGGAPRVTDTGLEGHTLAQLIEMTAQSRGLELSNPPEPSPKLRRRVADFCAAVERELGAWCEKNRARMAVMIEGADLYDAQGPYAVLMTLRGEGVGVDDGRWDHFVRDGAALGDLKKHLKTRLRRWSDGEGSGLLEDVLEADAEAADDGGVELVVDDDDDDDADW